jgi:hypothetical protein
MSGLEELKRYAESQAATQNNYGIAELIMEAVKDAERYAHLKKEWQDDFLIGYLDSNVHPCGWDEVIDARMNRSPENPF